MQIDFNFKIPEFDPVELERAVSRRHEAAKASVSVKGRFIGTSLGAWMERVKLAGVPVVPASVIAELPREVFRRAEEMHEGDKMHWDAMAIALSLVPENCMARWDACSCLELKGAMALGRAPTHAERTELPWHDPRAFDILQEFPADSFHVWQRPWIEAMKVDGYPVEFRVFVRNGKVIGVANYYPQRALPETAEFLGLAQRCEEATDRVVAYRTSTGEIPWMQTYAGGFDESKVSATLDFFATQDGEVMFLEAGPPYGAGAHPCSFIDREISGVALKIAAGVQLR